MRLTIRLSLAGLALSLTIFAAGCGHNCADCGKSAAECKAVKPGTITTANKVCVMMNDDPVDPAVTPVVWRGQSYGLCCNGCRSKWENLTDAQKDAAVKKAVALSK